MPSGVLIAWFVSLAVVAIASFLFGQRRASRRLDRERTERTEAIERLVELRGQERTGRIRAERRLKDALATITSQPAAGGDVDERSRNGASEFPLPISLTPIGVVRSCFPRRRGTPRQGAFVPSSRARLVLNHRVVAGARDMFDGIDGFSHVWVLFLMHMNTGAKCSNVAKVSVPRLSLSQTESSKRSKVGVLATRSPHHPCPLGLSLCRIVRVCTSGTGTMKVFVDVSGLDCVDGTPLLDIKPYVGWCDRPSEFSHPDWLSQTPFRCMAEVRWHDEDPDRVLGELAADCVLYRNDPAGLRQTIEEVLSNDIRSPYQASVSSDDTIQRLHFDGLLICYRVVEGNVVLIERLDVADSCDKE